MNNQLVEYINSSFMSNIKTDAEREKIAAATGDYLRIKLRERGVARHIINPQPITALECTRSDKHEGLEYIIDIEPDSKAMVIDFRSEPDGTYITGPRYKVPFFGITTDRFSKKESELASYRSPITKIIEGNMGKDIEYVEDVTFFSHVDAAIAKAEAEFGAGTKFKNVTVNTYGDILDGIVDGMNLIETGDPSGPTKDNNRPCGTIVMCKPTFNSLYKIGAEKLGLELRSEITKDGYIYDKLMGMRLVVTMKTGLVKPGQVYFFAPQEYLGVFYILNDIRMYIEKRFDVVEMQAQEEIGMGLHNISACACIQLSKI